MFMRLPYYHMTRLGGEPFAVTSDSGDSAILRGMYDRRILSGEVGGAEVRIPDYVIGIPSQSLPSWVAPGVRIDIRGDTLQVTALEPDGQGLIHLLCRPAV